MATPTSTSGFAFGLLEVPNRALGKEDRRDVFQYDMAMFRHMLIRGMNGIYEKATQVSTEQVQAFLVYVESWIHIVHIHHGGEEAILFPVFLQKGLVEMETNKSQHAAFHDGFEHLEEYVKEVKSGKQTYDGRILREKLSFGEVLNTHLNDEIATLKPEKLRKAFASSKEVDQVLKGEIEYAIKNSIGSLALPFICTHHDLETNKHFYDEMPLPPLILGRYILP